MKCHRLQIDRDLSMGFFNSNQQNRAPTRVPLFGKMTSHFWSRQISQRTVRLPESDRWSDKTFPGSHKYEEFSQQAMLGAYCTSWNIKDVQLDDNRRTQIDNDKLIRNTATNSSNSFDRHDDRKEFRTKPDKRNENNGATKKTRRRRLFAENDSRFSGQRSSSELEDEIVRIADGNSAREKSYKDVGVNTEDDKWEDKGAYLVADETIFGKKNGERNGLGTKTERHCRPLTPPRDSNYSDYANDLYENQYFATEYSKRADFSEQEPHRSTLNDRWTDRKQEYRSYPASDRKQKTIVEIRSDDAKDSQRYRSSDSEDEDYFRANRTEKVYRLGKSSVMPERKFWTYRDGGVQITDIENGQPCCECGELCSGFSPHDWRKNCTSCKCPREAHEVCHEEWVSVRARLGLKGGEPNPSIVFDPREKGFAWTPPGLPAHRVEEYFSMLPEISVARLGTPGERYRDRQLATQLPKQDLARAYCRHLEPEHSTSADDFMAARNEIALDIGSVQEVSENGLICRTCKEPLKYGSLAVSASKLGLLYHPMCFQCVQCKELLVDLAYCVHDDALYCERHYAEQLKPRCAACDELIFSGEYTKAMNKDWHSGHFCCWQCDESLTGQRYVLRDEHPYCIKCYESVFANGCEECNKIIGIDSKDLSYKDKHWHEACFLCHKCRVSLVDKQFGSKVDKIYCGNCYDAQFASRCDGCGEIFRAGTKKMEYKTRQWHEKCFCCCVCKNPIGTKSFIPREQEIYCAGCYEDKFATRCIKCNKIITSGGVTYKNEPWHRDCFTCTNCDMSLAGQRFTSRDDKPYCADCFGELFAKRCTACSKPITGIGGTRFISFEDRHWHNDCFICAGCSTSLVGRGFITDADDIICPDCAKSKLS